jgi:hypothetical protein
MILQSNLTQTILYDPAHPVSIAMKRMQDERLGSGLGLSVFNIQATGSQAGKPMPTPRAFRGRRDIVTIVAYEK